MVNKKNFVRDYALTCYYFDSGEESGEDYLIGRLVNRYVKGRRVLDLGCGPVVAVTSVFYPNAKEVVAVDKLKENLDFVKNNSGELNAFIDNARRYRKRYLDGKFVNPKIQLIQGDIRERLQIGNFDSAMQLGCFGCVSTTQEFQMAVNNTYYYLKPGGTALMVNWFNDKNEVKRPLNFNGPVNSAEIMQNSLETAGFQIKEYHITRSVLCKETRKLGYNGIVWAVAAKRA